MKLSFSASGGVWSDGTKADKYIFAEKGEEITIPEKPIKEGYKFLYWKGSKYQPGDKYVVVGNHKFVAEWEKVEVVKPKEIDADKYQPIGKDITVKEGKKLNPEEIIRNLKDLPKGTKISFKIPIDTNKAGQHEVLVEVEYPDGSKDEIKVKVTVKEKTIEKPNKPAEPSNPQTGDSGILIFIPVLLVAVVALFLVSKKKK